MPMNNVEKELKYHLDTIIRYAYKDDLDDSYFWYKIMLMNEPNKRMHGQYWSEGPFKYTIQLFQNNEKYETDADRLQVLIHEVCHHLQARRNRIDNKVKLYKNQPDAHKDDFWIEYRKMLYATLDLGYLTVLQMEGRLKDEAYYETVDGILAEYTPNPPENPTEYEIEQIYIFNSFAVKDKLKARGYAWNPLNFSWYRTLKKSETAKEKKSILELGTDESDIEVLPFNVLKMISDRKHYKPANKKIKDDYLALYTSFVSYLLNVAGIRINRSESLYSDASFDTGTGTINLPLYDDFDIELCIRPFYQIAQFVYNAYQLRYSLDGITIPEDGIILPGSAGFDTAAKGFALYIVNLIFRAEAKDVLVKEKDYDLVFSRASSFSSVYSYNRVMDCCIASSFEPNILKDRLAWLKKSERSAGERLEPNMPRIICLACRPLDENSYQLSIINGSGETLFNEIFRMGEAKDGIQSVSYFLERIQAIIERHDLIVGYSISDDMNLLSGAGVHFKEKQVFDARKEYATVKGDYDEVSKRYIEYPLSDCAKHYGFVWKDNDRNSLADAETTLRCYYRIRAEKERKSGL